MKISLDTKFISGPFGGASKFSNLFKDFLEKRGFEVVNNLADHDIDIIFHIAPYPFFSLSAYSFLEAYIYKMSHPKVLVIHRINECDERKGTHYMNKLLIQTAKYSDALIFIAGWLKPLLEKQGLDTSKPGKVILNGADKGIFNTNGKIFWDGKRKMRIVTHHWGGNQMKGHDFYQRLDTLLAKPEWKDNFEFTYIGNYPKDLKYENTKLVKPLDGEALAAELKKHDVYITASRNEPAGMHHIEGALCGLPILYIDSGALKEYCRDYGLEFNEENFEEKLLEMRTHYQENLNKILSYDRTAEKMFLEYYNFILEALKAKRTAANGRGSWPRICFYKIYFYIFNKYWKIKKKFLK